jgi:hypothetical protein
MPDRFFTQHPPDWQASPPASWNAPLPAFSHCQPPIRLDWCIAPRQSAMTRIPQFHGHAGLCNAQIPQYRRRASQTP